MRAELNEKVIFALPKGRILRELLPILADCDIRPEGAFFDESARQLRFQTSDSRIDILKVRAFDVATFVAHGGAQIGVVGSDVLEEFQYSDIYAPVDLGIGQCRLSVARHTDSGHSDTDDLRTRSHIRVATKYPGLTRRHFAAKGIQAECIKLSGAMELVPALGMAPLIVDLVSSGTTLRENDLVEIETIMPVSSRLIVNRQAFKTRPSELSPIVERFRSLPALAA